MPNIYVVRTEYLALPFPGVFTELQDGRARIGWSSEDGQDLRLIQEMICQNGQLNQIQLKARRCLGFFTNVVSDDYLIYPHQPQRGQFSVVQVTGDYDYSPAEEHLEWDFRSFRPCSLITPESINLYDEIVPSQLRHRLGVQGRFSQVNNTEPFFDFLRSLPEAGRQHDLNQISMMSLQRLHSVIRRGLADSLHVEFSRADLSRLFCRDLLHRMGYTPVVQEGPNEAGSDIVVTVHDRLLPEEIEIRIGIQIFSYVGEIQETDLQYKLDQLLGGWEINELDYGVLLTTGHCSKTAKGALIRHNNDNPNRLVRLIDGDILADLFLEYFPPNAL